MNAATLIQLLIRWFPQIISVVSAVIAALNQQQAATVAELAPLLPEDSGVQVVQGMPLVSIIGYATSVLSLIGGGLFNKPTPKPDTPPAPSVLDLTSLLIPLAKTLGAGLSAASMTKLVTLALEALKVFGEVAQQEAQLRINDKIRPTPR